MIRALRPVVGVPARLLIVFVALGTALPAALHGDASDDPCQSSASEVPSDPHLQAADGATAEHCGVCHWLRSLRVFHADAMEPQPVLAFQPSRCGSAGFGCGRLVLPSLPARAPPA